MASQVTSGHLVQSYPERQRLWRPSGGPDVAIQGCRNQVPAELSRLKSRARSWDGSMRADCQARRRPQL